MRQGKKRQDNTRQGKTTQEKTSYYDDDDDYDNIDATMKSQQAGYNDVGVVSSLNIAGNRVRIQEFGRPSGQQCKYTNAPALCAFTTRGKPIYANQHAGCVLLVKQ